MNDINLKCVCGHIERVHTGWQDVCGMFDCDCEGFEERAVTTVTIPEGTL